MILSVRKHKWLWDLAQEAFTVTDRTQMVLCLHPISHEFPPVNGENVRHGNVSVGSGLTGRHLAPLITQPGVITCGMWNNDRKQQSLISLEMFDSTVYLFQPQDGRIDIFNHLKQNV